MHLLTARFTIKHHKHGLITVTFGGDGDTGQPGEVSIWAESKEYRIENAKGRYKPCMTHAVDLIRHVLGKPPASNFAKQRKEKTRPALKLAHSDG